jgi:hypothetical protein
MQGDAAAMDIREAKPGIWGRLTDWDGSPVIRAVQNVIRRVKEAYMTVITSEVRKLLADDRMDDVLDLSRDIRVVEPILRDLSHDSEFKIRYNAGMVRHRISTIGLCSEAQRIERLARTYDKMLSRHPTGMDMAELSGGYHSILASCEDLNATLVRLLANYPEDAMLRKIYDMIRLQPMDSDRELVRGILKMLREDYPPDHMPEDMTEKKRILYSRVFEATLRVLDPAEEKRSPLKSRLKALSYEAERRKVIHGSSRLSQHR